MVLISTLKLNIANKSMPSETQLTLTSCLTEIKSWMNANFLKSNCYKLAIVIIGPQSLTKASKDFCIGIDSSTPFPSPHICSLSEIFASNFALEHQANLKTKTFFFSDLKNKSHLCLITLLFCCHNLHPCFNRIQSRLLQYYNMVYSPKSQ